MTVTWIEKGIRYTVIKDVYLEAEKTTLQRNRTVEMDPSLLRTRALLETGWIKNETVSSL